jgi:2-oxoglutarate ferredoxin oxidoreductase subunit delta
MTARRLLSTAMPSAPAIPILPASVEFYLSTKPGITTPNQPVHITTIMAEEERASKPKSLVMILSEYCKGCELCLHACPTGNLTLSDQLNRKGYHPAVFRYEGTHGPCSACGICYWVCPDMAISKVGRLRP